MASSRFIKDTGLTARMTLTMFLLGALFVGLVALRSGTDVEAELARLKASNQPEAIEASEGGDILRSEPETVESSTENPDAKA